MQFTNNSETCTSVPCTFNIAVDSLRAPSLIFTKPMYLLSACGCSWQMSVVSVWVLTDIFLCVNKEDESETAKSMPGRHSFNFFFKSGTPLLNQMIVFECWKNISSVFLCYSQCDTDMTHLYVYLHFYFLYHFLKSAQSNLSSKSSLRLSHMFISRVLSIPIADFRLLTRMSVGRYSEKYSIIQYFIIQTG